MDLTNPFVLAATIGLFTYFMTAVGAAGVFLLRNPSARLMDVLLGFSAGVMLAASFWSLLAPSVEIAKDRGGLVWLPTAIGFAIGGLTLWLLDKVMPHVHALMPGVQIHEGIATKWRRSTLLVLAITLHHIPEGLAIGVAAGAVGAGAPSTSVGTAIALGLGLGLQNLPEGLAVSTMLVREGATRRRGFFLGQLTGAVEPPAAIAGSGARHTVDSAPALRARVRGRRDGIRGYRGTHPRVSPFGSCRRGRARSDSRLHPDDRARSGARVEVVASGARHRRRNCATIEADNVSAHTARITCCAGGACVRFLRWCSTDAE